MNIRTLAAFLAAAAVAASPAPAQTAGIGATATAYAAHPGAAIARAC